MTNLDAMVEWGDEDNEQLNKMAVSSVEGDPNVAGVFVNWDNDDDFNDMNIAMTGDMVIRIAQGVTVERGDLLMSAGDGTAKPQGDDIVDGLTTIAKVLPPTHVVSTLTADGSYSAEDAEVQAVCAAVHTPEIVAAYQAHLDNQGNN
jgi:hypothetical protein